MEDKAKTTFQEPPPKTNENKEKENKEEKVYSEHGDGTKFFFVNQHVDKMEKLQANLMH